MWELMIFMFLFLVAFIAMYMYILKKIDTIYKQLTEEHAQLRVLIRAMESHLDHITRLEVNGDASAQEDKTSQETDKPSFDPLLSLSFEEPPAPEKEFGRDPGLELNFETPDTSRNN